MRYISRTTKNIIASLSGMIGFCDVLLSKGKGEQVEAARDKLCSIKSGCEEVMDVFLTDVNDQQLLNIKAFCDGCELMVMPKTSVAVQRELTVVDVRAVERLLSDVVTACSFCEKRGNEIATCETRNDLLACGIYPEAKAHTRCPYMEE